ncbi:MAG: hypothetical protein M3R47_12135 [Chloroflexota bacterium]|nr:hypothetical protein [Chloroflexota bacterium]
MGWEHLRLWANVEEQRIRQCILEALYRLIESRQVSPQDNELSISGKLRPFLEKRKKELRLAWTFHSEASCFAKPDAPKPIGHPDFRFSQNTPDDNQYDYDIECKLVRIKRQGKTRDYCEQYVTDGIHRFQSRKYAQSSPHMGTMIGYLQEGDTLQLLELVNATVNNQGWNQLDLVQVVNNQRVTHLNQHILREDEGFILIHLWADVRLNSLESTPT